MVLSSTISCQRLSIAFPSQETCVVCATNSNPRPINTTIPRWGVVYRIILHTVWLGLFER